jgi:hypothetical protein
MAYAQAIGLISPDYEQALVDRALLRLLLVERFYGWAQR